MEERYIRNVGALSEEECSLLREKCVFVAGCGGLGGHIIDMLLRLGVGEIRCADGDCFDCSNLNRQLLSAEDNISFSKAEAAAKHAQRVNSSIRFRAYSEFIGEDNALSLLSGCDIVIDALDNIQSRRVLKGHCDALGIPYIFGAVEGWTAQCAVSMPGDGLIERLYPTDTAPVTDMSVLSFVPSLCASMQVCMCVKLLCGRETETGKLFCFELDDFELQGFFM